ncbi:MAG: site-specific DNA-methyltransferase [Candidatus Atribacteria bacterium]|nr:site-specific DNA-methyltransferase [Candidatus Atribacteria bacterium]
MTDRVELDEGRIVLIRGDCLEVLPTLEPGLCDVCIADPPYSFLTSSAGTKVSMWADCINNARWFAEVLRMIKLVMRRGTLWMFTSWKTVATLQKASHDADLPITSMLVWDKDWIGPGGVSGLRPSYEMVALWCIGGKTILDRGVRDLWKVPWSSRKPNGHPAEKPEALIERILAVTQAQTILDPFGGSGTVAAVAARVGVPCVSIELEDKWMDLAMDRIKKELDQREGQGPLMRASLLGEPR